MTGPQTTEQMQHTIDELHNALWLALKCFGGKIYISPINLLAWGNPSGKIEWMDDPSSGMKIIWIVEKDA